VGGVFIVVAENVALSYKDNPLFDYGEIVTHADETPMSVELTDIGVLTLLALIDYIGDVNNWQYGGINSPNDAQGEEIRAVANDISKGLLNATPV